MVASAADCSIVTVCPAIAIVPVRAAPALGAAITETVPLPVPVVVPDTASHGASDSAVHEQPGWVAIATVRTPPVAATGPPLVDGAKVHVGGGKSMDAERCATRAVRPAIVTSTERSSPSLAAMIGRRCQGPRGRGTGDGAQPAGMDTDQGHWATVATTNRTEPPEAPTSAEVGVTANVHGAAACFRRTTLSLIRTSVSRRWSRVREGTELNLTVTLSRLRCQIGDPR